MDTSNPQPLVSVVMPAYNAERYIGEAISTVLSQTYKKWELLILDDCSSDRTGEIAELFEKADPRIHLFRNSQNLGAARTRNRGADIIYCSYAMISESGVHLSDFLVPVATDYEAMLRKSVLSCSTVLLRRLALSGHRFSQAYYHEDYVFWLELLKAGYSAVGCPEVLADYRLVRGSRSSDKRNAARNRWVVYRRVEKLPLGKSVAVFAAYARNALQKHGRTR